LQHADERTAIQAADQPSPEARWITGQDIQADAGFINSMIAGAPIHL
jgi:hypothetical protein